MCSALEYKGGVKQENAFVVVIALYKQPSFYTLFTNNIILHVNNPSLLLFFSDFKVIYRRYASLYFIAGTDLEDNELMTMEIIHRYVEVLDDWFLSVCELDIVYNFSQAYIILGMSSIVNYFTFPPSACFTNYPFLSIEDEFILGGEVQEHSKRSIKETLKALLDVFII